MNWVIIVDDDATNLKIAEHVLSSNGIQVTSLRSGHELLEYLQNDMLSRPDLILLDIDLLNPDELKTFRSIQHKEKMEIPVIFLSADQKQESEARGFELGALDFIRKPYAQDVLLSRVQNALRTQEKLHKFEREARLDSMTGFLNKNTAEDKINGMCHTEMGLLCILDLDSFKLINDLFGHDMGDRVLILFSDLLKNNMRAEDVCGRIGGDEFLIFAKNMQSETELRHFTQRINEDYVVMMKKLFGEQLKFPVGISIGAASVPAHGREYGKLFHLADQALCTVKQNGKHNCALSGRPQANIRDANGLLTLDTVTMILEERNISPNAMWMGREAFINIYRYMTRYMERYHGEAYRALFTVNMKSDTVSKDERTDIMVRFRHMMQESLRNSDVMVEVSENQIFLLLPEMHEGSIDVVVNRLMHKWNQSEYKERTKITWETGQVHLMPHEAPKSHTEVSCLAAVVCGDPGMLNHVEQLLEEKGMHVSALHNGSELMDSIRGNYPDFILLDSEIPDMDSGMLLCRLKGDSSAIREIPVIMMVPGNVTDDEILEFVRHGADEFITKPLNGVILMQRIINTIDLTRLQRNVSSEVSSKMEEDRERFTRMINMLATALDAKEADTARNSRRVARIAGEIAKRAGYTGKKQDDIYFAGLFYDIGKVGIPDTIIGKPGMLTDEEFEVMKTHTVSGARILQSIDDLPSLAVSARWHHERYDGKGYPDGLAGKDIPEEARIIAVADAYDAMCCQRSYRAALTEDEIRREFENGSGTQFDPQFAGIMLELLNTGKG